MGEIRDDFVLCDDNSPVQSGLLFYMLIFKKRLSLVLFKCQCLLIGYIYSENMLEIIN